MRIARLPDGQELQFPDEAPDEEMHAKVRDHMKGQAQRAEDTQLTAVRNQALTAVAQQIGQLSKVVYKLCEDQATTQRLLLQTVGAINRLEQSVGQAAQQVVSAVMAPTRQEIERDDDGKIAATNITKG
jgi:hypothetical protein